MMPLSFGLTTALSHEICVLLAKGDSKMVIKQVRREFNCSDPHLATYLIHAKKLESTFNVLKPCHIPQANNSVADEVSTGASTRAPVPDIVSRRSLHQPTVWPAAPDERGPGLHLDAGSPSSWDPTKGHVHHRWLYATLCARPTYSS
jgi:hypothetical protein